MRSITEWIEVDDEAMPAVGAPHKPHVGLVIDNMVTQWGGIPVAELSVILVHLRYLSIVHQTHHWIAKGDSFYGDHKLFEQLYDQLIEEIDVVAEKAVGLGSEHNVNMLLHVNQLQALCSSNGSPQMVPQGNDLAKQSLAAECGFMKVLVAACEAIKASGSSTPGVENMLQQLADTHEKHIYLLKRRCAAAVLGL